MDGDASHSQATCWRHVMRVPPAHHYPPAHRRNQKPGVEEVDERAEEEGGADNECMNVAVERSGTSSGLDSHPLGRGLNSGAEDAAMKHCQIPAKGRTPRQGQGEVQGQAEGMELRRGRGTASSPHQGGSRAGVSGQEHLLPQVWTFVVMIHTLYSHPTLFMPVLQYAAY